jgi:hypothetical protein
MSPATATRTRRCDGCGQSFDDLLDLVRHRDDCDASAGNTYGRHEATQEAAAHAARWAREAEAETAPRLPRPSDPAPNRYAGPCAACGHRVEAGAGTFVKRAGRFSAAHLPGACPEALAAVPVPAARTNRYAGPCQRCGSPVPAGAGTVAQVDGRWVTGHLGDCPPPAPEAPAGYDPKRGDAHLLDGAYYRVSVGQRSGRLYANRWDGAAWSFERGALGRLSTETLVTAEQAAAFGHATESCVFCGHDLDLPESISVGYGSTCAANRGLPWGAR